MGTCMASEAVWRAVSERDAVGAFLGDLDDAFTALGDFASFGRALFRGGDAGDDAITAPTTATR